MIFHTQKTYISKIKGLLVLKSIFSETANLLFCLTLFYHTKLFFVLSTFQLAASTKLFTNKENRMATFYTSRLVQSVFNFLDMTLN